MRHRYVGFAAAFILVQVVFAFGQGQEPDLGNQFQGTRRPAGRPLPPARPTPYHPDGRVNLGPVPGEAGVWLPGPGGNPGEPWPPRTQNAVCHTARPRKLSSPTTSICALPTLSTPNFTSYSIFSPTPKGTLACLTVEAALVWAAADWAGESTVTDTAKRATPAMRRLKLHLATSRAREPGD